MTTRLRKAVKRAVSLRMAIDGPTGAGKSLSALLIARGLVGPTGTIAVIDTEHGSSEKFYARRVDFDVLVLDQYQPRDYVSAIRECAGYDVLIIDSLSHAWSDGVMEMIDARGGQFNAWKDVTPHHKELVTALLTFPGHLIVTMRSKTAYEVSRNAQGKAEVVKLGLKPIQREGMEYEFDLVADMDQAHRLVVSKSRYDEVADRSILMPGIEFGAELAELAGDGAPPPPPAPDARARARELLAIAGDRRAEALRALADADIASDALVDDAVFEHARQIVSALPEPVVAEQPPAEPTPADPGDATTPAEPTGWQMTDAQRRKLWATINGAGWTEDGARSVIAEVTGDRSSSSIQSRDMFDQVLIALEAGPRPGDGQEAMEVPS